MEEHLPKRVSPLVGMGIDKILCTNT